jgi:hypothetical protein
MATSLLTRIHLEVTAALNETSPGSGGTLARLATIVDLLNGTGSGQADKVYFAQRSLDAASNEVLDLAGVLADPQGSTLTFAKVKLVAILNLDTVDGEDLVAGPDATNGWGTAGYVQDASDRRRINAGGCDIWYDPNGITVTAGSADELYVASLVGGVTYRILIVGTSA